MSVDDSGIVSMIELNNKSETENLTKTLEERLGNYEGQAVEDINVNNPEELTVKYRLFEVVVHGFCISSIGIESDQI